MNSPFCVSCYSRDVYLVKSLKDRDIFKCRECESETDFVNENFKQTKNDVVFSFCVKCGEKFDQIPEGQRKKVVKEPHVETV